MWQAAGGRPATSFSRCWDDLLVGRSLLKAAKLWADFRFELFAANPLLS
jgi:hypothetical protein